MKRPGMAKHTSSAFNEKSAIRILSKYLEQKRTIATFFKENDRTPNYDGSFELVGADDTPTKQFIVQIKKVENLTANVKGANVGKYVYDLDTSFLYYVKAKVTESPAIYFVVDIATNNIFWIYLSDELLMSLDFEGKERISYPFSESDIVSDIDKFVEDLKRIAAKRNQLFLQKTPEQISEMQDALDYINGLMENDFLKIKEAVFPNLWRFGIKYSSGETFSIIANGREFTSDSTDMFALYPQVKGVADTGLHEYSNPSENLFNFLDAMGNTPPMKYAQDTLHKIIKKYFEKGMPATQLPNIMLFERLDSIVRNIQRFYEFKTDDGKIQISDLYRAYVLLIRYIQHIIIDTELSEEERAIKEDILKRFYSGGNNFFNIFHCGKDIISSFRAYCKQYEGVEQIGFNPKLMFSIIPVHQIESFVDVAELLQRGVQHYETIWDYNFFELTTLETDLFMEKMNKICEKWFSNLPTIYDELFDFLFEKNKYRIKRKYEYRIEYIGNGRCGPWISEIAREYSSSILTIKNNPTCSASFTEADKSDGLLSVHDGLIIERFIQRKKLYYDGVRCLLYKGICDELGFDAKGLNFDGLSYSLF